MKPTVGSLFAGIGGIDLGLERAGFQTKWQVEIDDYARKVLQRHFPAAERFRYVKQFPPKPDSAWLLHRWKERFSVDILAAGFPCQDISYAGKAAGLEGEQSSLFYEAIRVVRVLGPRVVLLENVAGLLTRGIDQVLGTLASIGYDAEWHCIPAAYVGAPHIRDRVFILANSNSYRFSRGAEPDEWSDKSEQQSSQRDDSLRLGVRGWWKTEPGVPLVANGVSKRVERLRSSGNAVVPQIAEYIGRQIIPERRRSIMGEIIKVNSNEVPYEVQDEGGECWTQHETLEEAIKAFHETAKQKRDQNGYTATDEGDGAYLMLALYRGVAGKTCVDDYELHPTAEWSRITQALKKLEMYENGQADYELVRDQRDELAAELERVKAERDSARWQSSKWHELYNKKRKKLIDLEIDSESLKSRLPVNADGDVVLWGDEVWYSLLDGTPCGIYAKEIELNPDGKFIVPDGWRILDVQKELHSTAESCRAAHEGKEGENDAN